jgi:hypothetical protein
MYLRYGSYNPGINPPIEKRLVSPASKQGGYFQLTPPASTGFSPNSLPTFKTRAILDPDQISRLFRGHLELDGIDHALAQLAALGALYSYSQPTNGRHVIRWSSVAALQQARAEAE